MLGPMLQIGLNRGRSLQLISPVEPHALVTPVTCDPMPFGREQDRSQL